MVSTTTYEALTAREAYKILAKDILHNLKALVTGRVRRDRQLVHADYDSGVWKSVLDRKEWLRCKDVREFVTSAEERLRVAKIGNQLVRVKTQDYYAYRTQLLQEVIKEYAGGEEEVFELGCGCGYNVFTLAMMNHWQRLTGYDISEHAIQAAREAGEYFRLTNLAFGKLDLTDGPGENFRTLKGKTAFTYYCLEQLKYSTTAIIENLLRAGVRRVIHIEPSYELLRLWSLMDWATYLYVLRMDYQNNLLKTLRGFEKRGVLRIVDVKRLYYSPVHRNDPTLVCWESVAG